MTDAPRYRLVGYDIGTAPDENGGWVHWTDHEVIVARLTAERDRFEAALGRACLVGGTTYLLERAEKAEAERDAALAGAVKVKLDRETFDAMCAMRNSINEHIPMPSLESDLLQGPENSVFCATVAEAVIAEVTQLRDMANGTKVKQLEWHNFDAWTHWAEGACGTYHVEERNGYWQVELRVGGLVHGVTETGDTNPEDLDAAKSAAQADYDARIRAALQPDPDARQADLAKAWEMARDAVAGEAHGFWIDSGDRTVELSDYIRALLPPADLAAKIGGE